MGSFLLSLSFDVEEWDSPVVFGVESEYSMSDEFSARGCEKILDLLGRQNIHATFFVTGVFARNYPDIVREIVGRGHEVGCHADEHIDLKRLTKDELKSNISRGLDSVRRAAKIKPKGFRSPRNSVNPNLYGVLCDLSFEYDSSIHPAVLPGRLSDVFQRRMIHEVEGVVEVPISTFFGLPISWWWFRNIGPWYTALGCEVSMRQYGYALLYFHPWEFTHLPDVRGLPKHITNGVGGRVLADLEKFIVGFKGRGCCFVTVSDIASSPVFRRCFQR